jgi:hypothetical protein
VMQALIGPDFGNETLCPHCCKNCTPYSGMGRAVGACSSDNPVSVWNEWLNWGSSLWRDS